MQFKPKSEKEIQEANNWPAGEYPFKVLEAKIAVSGPMSKNPGTEFIRLKLQIWNDDDVSRLQNAILHPAMDAQLRHFCVETDMLDKYETGTLKPEDCEGKEGILRLKIKPDDGKYAAKNEVQDYGPKLKKELKPSIPSATSIDESDDVPF